MASICTRQSLPVSSGGMLPQLGPELAVQVDQPQQFLGPVEREDLPAAGIGVEPVGELGHRRRWIRRRRAAAGGSAAGPWAGRSVYLADCVFDAGERVALRAWPRRRRWPWHRRRAGSRRCRWPAGTHAPPPPAPPRCSSRGSPARSSRTAQAGGRSPGGLFVRASSSYSAITDLAHPPWAEHVRILLGGRIANKQLPTRDLRLVPCPLLAGFRRRVHRVVWLANRVPVRGQRLCIPSR